MTKFARIPELGVNTRNMSGSDWHVYVVIAFHADNFSGKAHPSLSRISAITGISRRHVSRSIDRLEERGLVRRQKVRRKGGWDRSTYQIVAADSAAQNTAPVIVPQIDLGVEQDRGVAENMLSIWKQECGDVLPLPRQLDQNRIKSCLARLKDSFNQDLKEWRALCREIRSSEFCCGGGSRGWKADFDWALKPNSILGLLEGKYRDNKSPRRRAANNGPIGFDDYFVPP